MDFQDEDILNKIDEQLGISNDELLDVAENMILEPTLPDKFIENVQNNINLGLDKQDNNTPVYGNNKKVSKISMVEKVLELQEKMNVDNPKTEATLKKLTKEELSRTLGKLINTGLSNYNPQSDENILKDSGVKVETSNNSQLPSVEVGAKALYNLNKLFSSVIESVNANVIQEYTNVSCKGYGEKLDDRKDELIELYKQIYKEYSGEINQYLSPINIILMINTETLISVLQKEGEKKP